MAAGEKAGEGTGGLREKECSRSLPPPNMVEWAKVGVGLSPSSLSVLLPSAASAFLRGSCGSRKRGLHGTKC